MTHPDEDELLQRYAENDEPKEDADRQSGVMLAMLVWGLLLVAFAVLAVVGAAATML